MLQVVLGISTLIYLVPTPVAAAHQAGSLALLSGVLVLGNRCWVPRRTVELVRQRVASEVGKGVRLQKGMDPNLKAVLRELHGKGRVPVTRS